MSRLNVAVSQDMCVIDVLRLFFLIVVHECFTTRHWQTSGRLVQVLNVCTVSSKCWAVTRRAGGLSISQQYKTIPVVKMLGVIRVADGVSIAKLCNTIALVSQVQNAGVSLGVLEGVSPFPSSTLP